MALLVPSLVCAPLCSPRSTLSLHIAPNFFVSGLGSRTGISSNALRLHRDFILLQRSFNGVRISSPSTFVERRLIIASASSETDGKEGSEADAASSEGSEEALPVENLPLESKLQLKLEQKLRMKLAKKIRLRRKRLLRKRRMRKKGRWPPSKMKKLKNV